jgi:hypothetical protein
MIYGYVVVTNSPVPHLEGAVPVKRDPAVGTPSRPIDGDSFGLLRTCRQIHDEASHMMYSENRFQIGVSMGLSAARETVVNIAMCKGLSSTEMKTSTRPWKELQSQGSSLPVRAVSVAEYERQLQYQESGGGPQRSYNIELAPSLNRSNLGGGLAFWTWEPPIVRHRFNKIRYLDIVLEVIGVEISDSTSPTPSYRLYIQNILTGHVDILHKLVNRLQRLNEPLKSLNVKILFSGFDCSTALLLEAAKIIMKPFLRLRSPAKIRSICNESDPFDENKRELSGEAYEQFCSDWPSLLNIDSESYEKSVTAFVQYYVMVISAVDSKGMKEVCNIEWIWSTILRRTMTLARMARESADVATLDQIVKDVDACMCAMLYGHVRVRHPRLYRRPPSARIGPQEVAFADLGEPFAQLQARTPWPNETVREYQYFPEPLWQETRYLAAKLPHMWAAGNLLSWHQPRVWHG